jgi:outer membrane immunogenic protein
MKWAAFGVGVAVALFPSLSVRAADVTPAVPPSTPAPSSYIPVKFLWSGFYLGTALGDAWGTSTFSDPFARASGMPSLNGILVGGLGGFNFQFDPWVIGIEGDFTGTWADGSVNDAARHNLQTKVFWTASLTGRVGYAFDRLLVYGKGGGGVAYDRDYVTVGANQAIGSTGRVGWTAGGGLEYAVTGHWIARIEYDYFQFASQSFLFTNEGLKPTLNGNGTVGFTLNEAKVALAYRF